MANTYSADFSSSVDCRLGSGCWPSSSLRRSTSCFATAYSPSVITWIFDWSSFTLNARVAVSPCDRCAGNGRPASAAQTKYRHALLVKGRFCEVGLAETRDVRR